MDEHPVADLKVLYSLADFNDFTRRLMPKYQRGLFLHIPAHHIARANPARPRLDQRLARPNSGDRVVFKTNIG